MDRTREIALKTLYKIDKEQAYSNIALNEEIKQNREKLTEKDIGLISEIVYGVTTWKLTLDEIIKKYYINELKKRKWIKFKDETDELQICIDLLDFKYIKNGSLSNSIFRQNPKISSGKRECESI